MERSVEKESMSHTRISAGRQDGTTVPSMFLGIFNKFVLDETDRMNWIYQSVPFSG